MGLIFVAALAPAIRLMPGYSAKAAGSAGFISPLLALPLLIAYTLLLSSFMKRRRTQEGLGELILRTNGRAAGGVILGTAALFLVYCCGFILRSGAERFISTVYPDAPPLPFEAVMLVIGTVAALGPYNALLRSARLFLPVLVTVLVLVPVFSLKSINADLLLPVLPSDIGGMALGAVPMLDVFAGMLCYSAILRAGSPLSADRPGNYVLPIILSGLLFSLLCLCCIGTYGAPLVTRFSHPFFTLIRNLTLFRSIEHVEAIVVTLWVLPDFTVFTLMLSAAARILRLLFGFVPERGSVPLLKMTNGRGLILACAALAGIASLTAELIPGGVKLLSELIIPLANMSVCLVLIPVAYIICIIRER